MTLAEDKPPAFKVYKLENEADTIILRRYADLVSFPLSASSEEVIEALCAAADTLGGVGLAAPQIGYPCQIVIVEVRPDAAALRANAEPVNREILINPSYEPAPGSGRTRDWEACFSVDSLQGKVPRFDSIDARHQDRMGNWIKRRLTGFHARVVQHEIDHIRGTLIPDRLTQGELSGPMAQMKAQRLSEMTAEQRQLAEQLANNACNKKEK